MNLNDLNWLSDFDGDEMDVFPQVNIKVLDFSSLYPKYTNPLRDKIQKDILSYISNGKDKLVVHLLSTKRHKLCSYNLNRLMDTCYSMTYNTSKPLEVLKKYKSSYNILKYMTVSNMILKSKQKEVANYMNYYESIRDYIQKIITLLQLDIFKNIDTNTAKVLLQQFMSKTEIPKCDKIKY